MLWPLGSYTLQKGAEHSSSPTSLWQVELVDATRGTAVTFGVRVRFRHLSGVYLCVSVASVPSQPGSPSHRMRSASMASDVDLGGGRGSPTVSRGWTAGRSATLSGAGGHRNTYQLRCVSQPYSPCDFTLHPAGNATSSGGHIPLTRHGLFVRHASSGLWLHGSTKDAVVWHTRRDAHASGPRRLDTTSSRASPSSPPSSPHRLSHVFHAPPRGADDASSADGPRHATTTDDDHASSALRAAAKKVKWLKFVDDNTQHEYFYNPVTGVTQWEVRTGSNLVCGCGHVCVSVCLCVCLCVCVFQS